MPREGDAAVKATVHFDGGGQYPAQTVAAATVRYDDGSVVDVVRTFKPGEGTNNTAEYQALILGLTTAYESGVTEVRVFGDSMVVVEQVNGRWKVKDDRLRGLCADAQACSRASTRGPSPTFGAQTTCTPTSLGGSLCSPRVRRKATVLRNSSRVRPCTAITRIKTAPTIGR